MLAVGAEAERLEPNRERDVGERVVGASQLAVDGGAPGEGLDVLWPALEGSAQVGQRTLVVLLVVVGETALQVEQVAVAAIERLVVERDRLVVLFVLVVIERAHVLLEHGEGGEPRVVVEVALGVLGEGADLRVASAPSRHQIEEVADAHLVGSGIHHEGEGQDLVAQGVAAARLGQGDDLGVSDDEPGVALDDLAQIRERQIVIGVHALELGLGGLPREAGAALGPSPIGAVHPACRERHVARRHRRHPFLEQRLVVGIGVGDAFVGERHRGVGGGTGLVAFLNALEQRGERLEVAIAEQRCDLEAIEVAAFRLRGGGCGASAGEQAQDAEEAGHRCRRRRIRVDGSAAAVAGRPGESPTAPRSVA